MKRFCLIIASATVLAAVLVGFAERPAAAADRGSPQWYDPSVVPSAEEALGDIKGLRGSVTLLDGKEADRVEVDEQGITIHTGAASASASEKGEEGAGTIHIPFNKVRGVSLSYRPLPKAGKDWVFCARLTGGAQKCVRAGSKRDVTLLADAVYTLALNSDVRICMAPLKLGVGLTDLTDEQLAVLGWGVDKGEKGPKGAKGAAKGAMMGDIFLDGPADRAGLRRLDVVTAVNGTPVADKDHFMALVRDAPARGRIKLTVFRAKDPESFEKFLADPALMKDVPGEFHDVFVNPAR